MNNFEKQIETIQEKLMNNLERLDKENENIKEEVARSNAVAQLSNTFIKTINLVIRVDESKELLRNEIKESVK